MSIEIRILSPSEIDAAEWDAFDPPTAHPANTTMYGRVYGGFLREAVFIEAWTDGARSGQWVLRARRVPAKMFRTELTAHAAPQLIASVQPDADRVFAEIVRNLRIRYAPVNITVLNYALTRGLSEHALHLAGFARVERFHSFVNDIIDDDAMLKSFHDSHRNDTRKALRDAYEYREQITVDEYLRLSGETYARSDSDSPSAGHIRCLVTNLVQSGHGLLSGVVVTGELQAASLILAHGENACYLHGASASRKARGATTLIHYENMRRLRERGVRRYDFGGARIEETASEKARSISAFKKRFGGRLLETYGGSLV